MLPSSGPIIAVSFIWQFTNIWNDFLFGRVSPFRQPADDGGAQQPGQLVHGRAEYNVHFAGAIMAAALPTLLVYIVAGRYFVRGLMA
jgi:glucose/mannose transport system permease protein